MTQSDDIANSIADNALGPKRVQVGDESVEQLPVPEQIAAANFVAAQTAATKPGFGLRSFQIVPPAGG